MLFFVLYKRKKNCLLLVVAVTMPQCSIRKVTGENNVYEYFIDEIIVVADFNYFL